ncbi:DUF2274 domain-containing protein [Rhodospirillum sp. A1_3_36]|uniref:DUF2274 domain-containing protein n=1 Tax=Rhodospirillum sp. A1_3_36 TaxID=3391666 RepID=UPI0039A53CBF
MAREGILPHDGYGADATTTLSVNADLGQAPGDYAALYKAIYGEAETVADLIPFMLEAFPDSDRAFAKARKEDLPGLDRGELQKRTVLRIWRLSLIDCYY